MGTQVALNHRTEYRYDKTISLGPQTIQLRPAPWCRTPILNYALDITPADHLLNWQLDLHSNYLARIIFPNQTDRLIVDVNLIADLTPINPFDFFLEPGFEQYPFSYSAEAEKDLTIYLQTESGSPQLDSYYENFRTQIRTSTELTGTISVLLDLNRKIRDEIAYVTRLEPGVQSCEETIQLRSGSCRDSSWLLVQMLRKLGIAARFVTGYLIQLADDEPSNTSGLMKDSADLHAWAEAYLPGAGWIGFDPTSGLLTAEGHIPLAATPSATGTAPIGGTMQPANVDFSFSMFVRRLNEIPTLTRPFSDAAWASIEEVATKVDADLAAQDVRLTMGGEPTFVGIDEPESPQWNIDALGPVKRTRGLDLIRLIRDRVAPGGLLHYGQGKWYPGEPLPRWALSCYWRKDGVPVWDNPDLIAREISDARYTTADALNFAQALTRRLEVSLENLLPAFNPGNDEAEAAGYILPIRRRQPEGILRWSSQLWFPRPDRFLLLQGDSPIGFRLPTEAMPWVAPDEIVFRDDDYEDEPVRVLDQPQATDETKPDRKAKLPARLVHRPELFALDPAPDPLPALSSTAESAKVLIRTAVCIEVREGRLCIFLPFSSELADYLDMIAAVEDTAEHLGVKIWVEGYTPPSDSRLQFFSVTPDPGVLEVNLPPASNWVELEALNTLLFEEATSNRLTAEKFNYDGSHVSTGGGSHIVIGGATVLDSPFLRRPDLLRSMVAFWQNHPSLSYLFSGIYVGPTSQYPRVDEARTDALYELEVAFANLPVDIDGPPCEPWVLDGLFRNLLADMTGNTHRAEFCIDKLYPPEGLGLQLGLLELRAFEMAPHLRMGLLQSLLIRALVATFWKTPFTGSLIRWGSALHDRYMLPHFVQTDFADVLAHLNRAGFHFDVSWFRAQFDFRFPRIGSVSPTGHVSGVELELRHALEPWNVLAEETASGRTVRSVDSSMERLQVKVSGLTTESRYIALCNGRTIPLTPTAEPGISIAGIRFRARRLSATLHPTIPVHAPLVFQLIDTQQERTVGQCTYFVTPPDGRVYPARPANADEAKSRREERFHVDPPQPDRIKSAEKEQATIFPMTLDLRFPI